MRAGTLAIGCLAASSALGLGACSERADDGDGRGGTPHTGGDAGASATPGAGTVGMGGITSLGGGGAGGNPGASGAAPGAAGALAGSGGSAPLGGASGAGGAAGSDSETGGTSGAAGAGGVMSSAGAGGSLAGGGGAGGTAIGGQAGTDAGAGGRSISFGTLLNPQSVVRAAQELAVASVDSTSPGFRAKGDQRRSYRFPASNSDEPYRLCVPSSWDGTSDLPLVMFLHGAGSDENTYVDQNGKQLVNLAEEHGFLLVSPKGVAGAYGNFLRLSAPFGDPAGAAELMSQVTDETERANQLSEQDVINVLELILHEYPIDRGAMFLAGHSMGSGGTWYIGGKYASYWKAIAPLSGPFVQESGYPWDAVRPISIFVTEGTQTPSLDASRLLRDWLEQHDFTSEYLEVNADHGGMIPLVMPDIFDFFERTR